MLQGDIPFERDEEILRAEVQWRRPISQESQELILACLRREPGARPSLAEILDHPWLREQIQDIEMPPQSSEHHQPLPQSI